MERRNTDRPPALAAISRCALLYDCHFLFVCKPDSHQTLYHWVNLLRPGPDLGTVKLRLKADSQWHTYTYRWANQIPLVEGPDALRVNWCEVTVTDPEGKVLYLNAWIKVCPHRQAPTGCLGQPQDETAAKSASPPAANSQTTGPRPATDHTLALHLPPRPPPRSNS